MKFKKSYIIDALIILIVLSGAWIGIHRERYFEVQGRSARGLQTTYQTLEKNGFEAKAEVKGTTLQGAYVELEGEVIGASPGRIYLWEREEDSGEVYVIGEKGKGKVYPDVVPNSVKLWPYENHTVALLQLKPFQGFDEYRRYLKRTLTEVNYTSAFVSTDILYPNLTLPEISTAWQLKRRVSGGFLTNNTEGGFLVKVRYSPYGSFKGINNYIAKISGKKVQPTIGRTFIKVIIKGEMENPPGKLQLSEKGKIDYAVLR